MTLVAYYPLDEDSGSTAYDVVGGNDGTINGATLGATGIAGTTAYSFDGSNDYWTTGGGNAPSLGNSVSVSAWFKTTEAISWVTHESESNVDADIFRLRGDGSGHATFRVGDADSSLNGVSGSITVNDGVWHLVTGTYDGSTITIYVDGEFDGSASVSGGLMNVSSPFVAVGADWYSGYTAGRGGSCDVDDVRFYDRALSPMEVRYLYAASVSSGQLVSVRRTL